MSGSFMAFTWGLSLVFAIVATLWLRAGKVLGIILGLILAQGLMFVGAHLLHIWYGPVVNMGGTETPVVTDIVLALIGALLGAWIARAFRRNR
jgi:hypothetical protein